ncbi:hypothetical protein TWF481_001034 [Arthrobotrys musiformis]|uniref:F-box domain-containing protein n=1 Tax=Arthrobotrys musiformis TaxID=47236 RepID=A0AAV9WRE8_9PEZI
MANLNLSLETIPLDALYQILLRIDNKTDLENICVASPAIECFAAENTHIVDGIYWREIKNEFLMPLALLNSMFNRSDETLGLLRSLWIPDQSEDGGQGEEDLEVETGSHDPDPEEDGEGEEKDKKDPNSIAPRTLDSLSPETIAQMKSLHIQIEKLARIFMNRQLERHYPPPASYRSPTAEERARIIMAVYRAYIMVNMRFVILWDYPMSSAMFNTHLEITDMMTPQIEQDAFTILSNQWTYWELKEMGVVLERLWCQIPTEVLEEAIGRDADMDEVLVKILCRRVRRRSSGIIPAGSSTKHPNPEFAERYVWKEWIKDMISFIFSMRDWNPERHVEFLDNLGHRQKSIEWLSAITSNDDCLLPLVTWEQTPNCHSMNVALRTKIYALTEIRILYLVQEELRKDVYARPGYMWYCRPPPRRLIKGETGLVSVPRFEDTKFSREAQTWVSSGQENVCTMVEDCMWDDWRLEGWGYHFPEFVQMGHWLYSDSA